MNDKENLNEKSPSFISFSFFIFGISCLCSWNAIISCLDFFIYFQNEFSPSFIYPQANTLCNLIMTIFLLFFRNFSSFKITLIVSLIFNIILLSFIPISTIFLNGITGFAVTMTLMLSQCIAGCIMTSSFFTVVSYLPKDCIIYFSLGQGMSGIVVNIIRYIILISFSSDDKKKNLIIGTIIFFCVASFLLTLSLMLLIFVFRHPFFVNKIIRSEENISVSNDTLIPDSEGEKEQEPKENNNNQFISFNTLKEVIKSAIDVYVLILFSFFISLSLYPGLSNTQYLFNLKEGYLNNTHSLIYNVFSCLGRKLTSSIQFSKKCFVIISFIRILFFVSFPLLIYIEVHNFLNPIILSLITMLNLMLCSFSNGFIVTVGYFLAPHQTKASELKKKTGTCIYLFQAFGLFFGSTMANLVMKQVMNYLRGN